MLWHRVWVILPLQLIYRMCKYLCSLYVGVYSMWKYCKWVLLFIFYSHIQTGSCPDHWLSWRQIRTDEPISRKPGRHWYTTVSRYPKFSPITWPFTMPSGIPQWPAERQRHRPIRRLQAMVWNCELEHREAALDTIQNVNSGAVVQYVPIWKLLASASPCSFIHSDV